MELEPFVFRHEGVLIGTGDATVHVDVEDVGDGRVRLRIDAPHDMEIRAD